MSTCRISVSQQEAQHDAVKALGKLTSSSTQAASQINIQLSIAYSLISISQDLTKIREALTNDQT
jgi:hypothetical protein